MGGKQDVLDTIYSYMGLSLRWNAVNFLRVVFQDTKEFELALTLRRLKVRPLPWYRMREGSRSPATAHAVAGTLPGDDVARAPPARGPRHRFGGVQGRHPSGQVSRRPVRVVHWDRNRRDDAWMWCVWQ
jgi:hypothetical protein